MHYAAAAAFRAAHLAFINRDSRFRPATLICGFAAAFFFAAHRAFIILRAASTIRLRPSAESPVFLRPAHRVRIAAPIFLRGENGPD
jgi:hypothetical protein